MTSNNSLKKQNTGSKNKVILMFPGQGSQYIGMGAQFLGENKEYENYLEIAGDVFGENLLNIINNKDDRGALLDQTQYSQVTIYSLSCALNDYLFKQKGFEKSLVKAVLGHSLGEYSALYSCGAFDFRHGAQLVSYRGKLMADFAKGVEPTGRMALENFDFLISASDVSSGDVQTSGTQISGINKINDTNSYRFENYLKNSVGSPSKMMMAAVIGSDVEAVESVLQNFKNKVFIANYNDYSQIVISGLEEEVLKAGEQIKSMGAKRFLPLKVNIASHCPLMKEVSKGLEKYISSEFKEFSDLNFKFYSSTEADFIGEDRIKDALVNQLVSPVRWINTIEQVLTDDVSVFIEVGPGKVLSGLVKRISSKLGREDITILNMDSLNDINILKTYLGA